MPERVADRREVGKRSLVQRTKRGERRISPGAYKALLTFHIVVAVGWLGIIASKLVLGIVAATSDDSGLSGALYVSMEVVNVAFPPAAIATLISGVLLSLGTKWGLLRHYWVATKFALTVAVIATAVAFVDGLNRQAIERPAVELFAGFPAPTLLVAISAAHIAMLIAATVLSVYKPWGRTPLVGRRAGRAG